MSFRFSTCAACCRCLAHYTDVLQAYWRREAVLQRLERGILERDEHDARTARWSASRFVGYREEHEQMQ